MTAHQAYANRSIGVYSVGLAVVCTLDSCTVRDEAAVAATSCEDARTGVMRVLRYRGWQLGKHAETRCPKHAPPAEPCGHCGVPTPPVYLRSIDYLHRDIEMPEKWAALTYKTRLCEKCWREYRDDAHAAVLAHYETSRS
jgi:hypothetical protein